MFTRSSLGLENAVRLLEGDDTNVDHNSRLPFFVPKMGILEKLCICTQQKISIGQFCRVADFNNTHNLYN